MGSFGPGHGFGVCIGTGDEAMRRSGRRRASFTSRVVVYGV